MSKIRDLQNAITETLRSLRDPGFSRDPEGYRYRIEQRLSTAVMAAQPEPPTGNHGGFNLIAHSEIHGGEGCMILCNGPSLTLSLAEIQLVYMKHPEARPPIAIGMNRSWKEWHAEYHVTLDEKNLREEAVREHPRLLYHYGDCPGGWFVPYRNDAQWFDDLHRGVPPATNTSTTLLALQLAVYLGFSRIYMLGLDLNRDDHFDGTPTRIALPMQVMKLTDIARLLEPTSISVRMLNPSKECPAELAELWPAITAEEILETEET